MITCPIHPDYAGLRPPRSKAEGCVCWDVFNARTASSTEYVHKEHKNMMRTLSRKPAEQRAPTEAQTCWCGQPALYIIRKYQQKDRPVCKLHRDRTWPV